MEMHKEGEFTSFNEAAHKRMEMEKRRELRRSKLDFTRREMLMIPKRSLERYFILA